MQLHNKNLSRWIWKLILRVGWSKLQGWEPLVGLNGVFFGANREGRPGDMHKTSAQGKSKVKSSLFQFSKVFWDWIYPQLDEEENLAPFEHKNWLATRSGCLRTDLKRQLSFLSHSINPTCIKFRFPHF